MPNRADLCNIMKTEYNQAMQYPAELYRNMTHLSEYILSNVDEEPERNSLRDIFTDTYENFRQQSDLVIHNRELNENWNDSGHQVNYANKFSLPLRMYQNSNH